MCTEAKTRTVLSENISTVHCSKSGHFTVNERGRKKDIFVLQVSCTFFSSLLELNLFLVFSFSLLAQKIVDCDYKSSMLLFSFPLFQGAGERKRGWFLQKWPGKFGRGKGERERDTSHWCFRKT